jgi:hypothetical protein
MFFFSYNILILAGPHCHSIALGNEGYAVAPPGLKFILFIFKI